MSEIAVVTGASRGIGRAIAIQLSKAGYDVHGTYNSSKESADQLSAEFGIKFHQVDLSNRTQTLSLVKELSSLQIATLVNDAGIYEADELENMNYQNWDNHLAINLTAPLILSLELSKAMQSGSSIVNITSTDGMMGAFDGLSYAASKAALINTTKSLGNFLGPKGIRVNALLHPAGLMQPWSQMCQPKHPKK